MSAFCGASIIAAPSRSSPGDSRRGRRPADTCRHPAWYGPGVMIDARLGVRPNHGSTGTTALCFLLATERKISAFRAQSPVALAPAKPSTAWSPRAHVERPIDLCGKRDSAGGDRATPGRRRNPVFEPMFPRYHAGPAASTPSWGRARYVMTTDDVARRCGLGAGADAMSSERKHKETVGPQIAAVGSDYDAAGKSVQDIENDISETRAELGSTLHDIEREIAPQHLLQRAIGSFKDGMDGGMGRRIGGTLRDNPTALILMGVGLGWFALSASRRSGRAYFRRGRSCGRRRRACGHSAAGKGLRDRQRARIPGIRSTCWLSRRAGFCGRETRRGHGGKAAHRRRHE